MVLNWDNGFAKCAVVWSQFRLWKDVRGGRCSFWASSYLTWQCANAHPAYWKCTAFEKKCNIRLFFITCCISAERERRRDRLSTNVCLNKHIFWPLDLQQHCGACYFYFSIMWNSYRKRSKMQICFQSHCTNFFGTSGSISLNQVLSVIHFFIFTLSTTQMGPRKI